MMTLFVFYVLVALPAAFYIAYMLGHEATIKNILIDAAIWPFMLIMIYAVAFVNYIKELEEYTPEQAFEHRQKLPNKIKKY